MVFCDILTKWHILWYNINTKIAHNTTQYNKKYKESQKWNLQSFFLVLFLFSFFI